MNVALPALAVLLLILPGILITYTYRKGFSWRSPIRLGSLQNELGLGIVFALSLHAIGINAAQ